MELGGTGLGGFFGVDHHSEWFVIDIDQVEGIAGNKAVFGDNHGHCFTHKPYYIYGHGTGGIHIVFKATCRPSTRQRVDVEQICADEHRYHARQRSSFLGIDRENAGVGIWATQHRGMRHAVEFHIIQKISLAGDEFGIFTPFDGTTNHRFRCFRCHR